MAMTRHSVSILWVILLSLHLGSVSYGQSTWVGGTGVWSNANNWCPAALPNGVDVAIGACKFAPPSTVTDDTFASINNLSIDAGNSLSVAANVRLTINGASISNAGTLAMSGLNVLGEGAQILLGATPTVTLSGGGTFLMNDAPNLVIGAGSSMTLVNQETIRGAGTLGAEGFFNLNNQGLVDAQGTNPLQINTISGSSVNTGIMQASNGGLLVLSGTSATNPLNNAGGTIQALDSSIVRLENPTFITGGTLTTKGTGLIHGVDGGLTNLTNAGLFQVGGISGFGSATIRLSGTITNSGTIQIGSPAWGDDGTEIDGAVTLTGGGTVKFANSIEQMVGGNGTPSVTNTNNTISGTGIMGGGSGLTLTNSATVDANSASGPLVLVLSMTNTGTMEASNGGELRTEGDIKNSGGTIQALDKSKVTLVSNTITGGTLATSGSGVIQTASTQPLLDGVANTGLLSIPSGAQAAFKDTITNSGTISADRAGNFIISGPVSLQGKGKVTLSNSGSNFISGGGTSPSWTNVDNLIEGAGTIAVPLTNQIKGTIFANVSNPLNLQTSPVTNLGTFQVKTGSTLDILGGVTFTNFSGTTLTGGTYIVAGTFEFSGANIATNAANIQLTSSTGCCSTRLPPPMPWRIWPQTARVLR
jgi:fibronectin-binding autotransporter adhesin